MQRRRHVVAIMAASGVSAIVACVPVGPVSPPSANPSASTAPATPTPVVSSDAQPVPAVTPIGSVVPGHAGTMAVTGRVFDESSAGVPGATIVAKVLDASRFANGSDTQVATSDDVGAYVVRDCPTGTTVMLTASKPGWTTRSRTHVPVSSASPGANVVDFGGNDRTFAISDAPEVTQVTMQGDALGIAPTTTISLIFSESVETSGVEQAFAVYAAGPATTGDPAVWRFASGGGLPIGYDVPTDTLTAPDKPIWDMRMFQATWREGKQEVILTFRNGYRFPADRAAGIGYALVLNGTIQDASGHTRKERMFRLKANDPSKIGYAFTTVTDKEAPRVVGVSAVDGSAAAAPALPNDRIRVTYSKPIVYQPLSLADGAKSLPDATTAKSALNASNYRYMPSGALPEVWPFVASPKVSPVVNAGHTVVEFAPAADSDVARGGTVWVQVAGQVTDPAGNPIETGSQGTIGSGRME